MNVSRLAPYAKTVAAVAGALVVTAAAVADGVVSGDEWIQIAAAWAAVLGVHHLPNKV